MNEMNKEICSSLDPTKDAALMEQLGCGTVKDFAAVASDALTVIISIVGILAVIGIIIGGVQYTISAGDASKTKRAKNTILYSVIGLVVALLSWAIVNFVLKNLA